MAQEKEERKQEQERKKLAEQLKDAEACVVLRSKEGEIMKVPMTWQRWINMKAAGIQPFLL